MMSYTMACTCLWSSGSTLMRRTSPCTRIIGGRPADRCRSEALFLTRERQQLGDVHEDVAVGGALGTPWRRMLLGALWRRSQQPTSKCARALRGLRARPGAPCKASRCWRSARPSAPTRCARRIAAGQRAFGENYVQEALDKIAALADLRAGIEWHLIGPLQSNKTRAGGRALRLGALGRPAEDRAAPERAAARRTCRRCRCACRSTSAARPARAAWRRPRCRRWRGPWPRCRGCALRGLMAIPEPAADFGGAARAAPRAARTAATQLQRDGLALDTLSMGMSADLEAAIAEGATIVRVGTAIFGARGDRRAGGRAAASAPIVRARSAASGSDSLRDSLSPAAPRGRRRRAGVAAGQPASLASRLRSAVRARRARHGLARCAAQWRWSRWLAHQHGRRLARGGRRVASASAAGCSCSRRRFRSCRPRARPRCPVREQRRQACCARTPIVRVRGMSRSQRRAPPDGGDSSRPLIGAAALAARATCWPVRRQVKLSAQVVRCSPQRDYRQLLARPPAQRASATSAGGRRAGSAPAGAGCSRNIDAVQLAERGRLPRRRRHTTSSTQMRAAPAAAAAGADTRGSDAARRSATSPRRAQIGSRVVFFTSSITA